MQKEFIKIKKISSLFYTILSAFIIFIFWYFFSKFINSSFVVPKPVEVFYSIKKIIFDKLFLQQVFFTVFRSIVAFFISLILSIIFGVLCGVYDIFYKLFDLPLAIIKAAPVVSFILCALFLFTTSVVPIFVSVLMTMPVLINCVANGIKNTNKSYLQMATIFSLSKKQKIKYIYIPSVNEFLFTGFTSSFTLSWKVVVASEVLCLPKYSVGTAMYSAKVHLETADVYAISLVIIILSFVCEKIAIIIFNFFSRRKLYD